MALIRRKEHEHVNKRAKQLSGIAKDMHRSAPRGGKNTNMFGEQRSAPGEPPAMETGTLFAIIDQGITFNTPTEAEIIVNYAALEYGYTLGARSHISDKRTYKLTVLKPRPLGRLTLAKFRSRIK